VLYIYIYIYIYICVCVCVCVCVFVCESLARGPKLLSIYTVEERGFLVRKYWQTGSLEHARRHFERNLVKDLHHRSVASRNWLKS